MKVKREITNHDQCWQGRLTEQEVEYERELEAIQAKLDKVREALCFAESYIEYVRRDNPELHEEANGTPPILAVVNEALALLNQP